MHEYIVNLHMHTTHSDGTGSHEDIAQAAIRAGIDVVIVTDHNVWVQGSEGYYQDGENRVLLLVGEEVHDTEREPQKNHLLVFGAEREMSPYAQDPQELIDKVAECGGLAFIAHPSDPEALNFNEPDLSWVDWHVHGYTGIELWNAMSEFKGLLKNKWLAIYYAFNPDLVAHGPFPEVLEKWDQITTAGSRLVAVGGSDAHAMHARLGPIKRVLFPYEFHFQAVNTHIFTDKPLTGDAAQDKELVLNAFRNGHAFIGYDLIAPASGFRFSAQGVGKSVWMGDEITAADGITLKVRLPMRVECSLIKDGTIIQTWTDREVISFVTSEPGVYRIEAHLEYRRKRRGWIFSNPIYVR